MMVNRRKGRTFKTEVVDKSRDKRWREVINEFRLVPYAHPHGPYAGLLPRLTTHSLFGWIIMTPFNVFINTLCALIRTLRPGLTASKMKKQDFVNIDMVQDCKYIDKHNYFANTSLLTNCAVIIAVINRVNTDEKKKWRRENVNADQEPEWFHTDNLIDIDNPRYQQLKDEIEKHAKLCLLKKGDKKVKAKAIKSTEVMSMQQNVFDLYYPKHGEKWVPYNMNKAMMVKFAPLQVVRGSQACRKRDEENITIDGDTITIKEPLGTKTMKTAEQLKNRKSNTFSKRADGKGIYRLVRDWYSIRHRAGITTKATVNSALFLRPKGQIKLIKGYEVGFDNMAVGHGELDRIFKETCTDLGIDAATMYSMRPSVATTAARIGMDTTQIGQLTGHTSTAINGYIRNEENEEEKLQINDAYQEALITGNNSRLLQLNNRNNASAPVPTTLKVPTYNNSTLLNPNCHQSNQVQVRYHNIPNPNYQQIDYFNASHISNAMGFNNYPIGTDGLSRPIVSAPDLATNGNGNGNVNGYNQTRIGNAFASQEYRHKPF